MNSESHSSTTPRSEPSIFLRDPPSAAWWTQEDRGQRDHGEKEKRNPLGEHHLILMQHVTAGEVIYHVWRKVRVFHFPLLQEEYYL